MDLTFEVKLFAPTSLKDVDAFITEYRNQAHRLMVQINPTGLGDTFADRLESAGFTVVRKRTASNPIPAASELVKDLERNS